YLVGKTPPASAAWSFNFVLEPRLPGWKDTTGFSRVEFQLCARTRLPGWKDTTGFSRVEFQHCARTRLPGWKDTTGFSRVEFQLCARTETTWLERHHRRLQPHGVSTLC